MRVRVKPWYVYLPDSMRGMLPEVLVKLEGAKVEVSLAPSGLPCLRLTGVVGDEWRKQLFDAFPLLSVTQQHELDFLFTKWVPVEVVYGNASQANARSRRRAKTTSGKARKRTG